MRRYLIKFSYIGTKYRGMQKNIIPSAKVRINDTETIQGAIEGAFLRLVPQVLSWPTLTCSSRTDAGVHGLCNIAHIDIENKYDSIYNPQESLKHLNRHLILCDHDIRILDLIPVKDTFHVKHCANSRTYLYRILKAKDVKYHKVPIIEMERCFHFRSETFDPEKISLATQLFMGLKDFRTFCSNRKSNAPVRYVRSLDSLTFEKGSPLMPYDPFSENFDFWDFKCTSKGFLYKQVRKIVTALLALGIGKITEKDITVMLQVPGHKNYMTSLGLVPPHGLYLLNVGYNQDYLNEHIIKYRISDDGIVVPLNED
ncbi:hypothetical protein E2986_07887 [Frieseomelitta varia]|uniref:tRNA pseudouridine synthase n=2 Tax=Frieseomelitta varia TaxID=561572 RepID=A0A833RUI3_9HYME|nr:tRNA pseudouridine synthase-like 1 isoform X1 [Frieseomelitta varia]KAF3423795.1 hypothetical protein E2986_07887 [Frieseomelitta varia]